MLKLLLSWIVAGLIINIVIRRIFKTTPTKLLVHTFTSNSTPDYIKGYLVGTTNVKMYYYIVGKMPTANWLDTNKYHLLSDRDKLIETLDETLKGEAGIIDSQRKVEL